MLSYWGDAKIDPNSDEGHVSLTCKNHPTKHWSTKNIGYIGARTIFFDGDRSHNHEINPTYIPHEMLRDKDECGPFFMKTSCSMRAEIFGDIIRGTPLDCECDCPTSDLVLENAS